MQPPSAPPQWSADGQWWWDGMRWRPRNEVVAPPPVPPPQPWYMPPPPTAPSALQAPPPGSYWVQPASPLAPSPGLRVFLLVVLSINTAITGLFALVFVIAVISGPSDATEIAFGVATVLIFAASVVALVGVVRRAPWSRVAAIVAGAAVSLTCLGSVLGIPILVAAARAPDMSRPRVTGTSPIG